MAQITKWQRLDELPGKPAKAVIYFLTVAFTCICNKRTMNNKPVQIVSYQPEFARHFAQLNKAWIEENFKLEPIDNYVLENPEAAILNNGGQILFAAHEEKIIGTVGLKRITGGLFELTKMAVDKEARGMGAGKLLCKAAIEMAINMGAQELILYSNTRQAVAIGIYRQLGFTELPLEPGTYQRANIKMGLSLKDTLPTYGTVGLQATV